MAFNDINSFLDCYLIHDGKKCKVTGIHSSNADFVNIYSFANVFQIPKDKVVLQYFTGMVDSRGEKIYHLNRVKVGESNFTAVKGLDGYMLVNRVNKIYPSELVKILQEGTTEVKVLDND